MLLLLHFVSVLQLHRLQIDNQSRGAVYPVVLCQQPLLGPKTAKVVPRPFIEVAMMRHVNDNLMYAHYKFVKVMWRELTVFLCSSREGVCVRERMINTLFFKCS